MKLQHISPVSVNSPHDSFQAYEQTLDQLTRFEGQLERRLSPWIRAKYKRGEGGYVNPSRGWLARNFTDGCCPETVTRAFAKFNRLGLFVITQRRQRGRGNLKRQMTNRIALPSSAPRRPAPKPKPEPRAAAEATPPPADQQLIPEVGKNVAAIQKNKKLSLKGGPPANLNEINGFLAVWRSRGGAPPGAESS